MRGAILPIVDLGALLGLTATVTTKQNVIIVVEASGQVIGLLVDGVSDTLTVTNEMVQPAPPIAAGASIANIGGLVEIEGRLMTLLQLDALDFTGFAAVSRTPVRNRVSKSPFIHKVGEGKR